MQVLERKPIVLKIKDLKFDRSNPNQMSDAQMEGLRQSMKRFGYLVPIIVDQNLRIADGEHRVKIYKEFGRDTILGYKMKFTDDIERRLVRQTMNKNKGTHDLVKDAKELALIAQHDQVENLALLIGQTSEYVNKMIQELGSYEGKQMANLSVNEDGSINEDQTNNEDITNLLNTKNKCPQCGYKW